MMEKEQGKYPNSLNSLQISAIKSLRNEEFFKEKLDIRQKIESLFMV